MKHIRIISPSGAIDNTYINSASARLRAWGYDVSVGTHATGQCGRFAATDEERIQDWCEACLDPSIDIILCSRGGYGLQRIIDRLPATDKIVVGFSDITELHQLQMHSGHISIHGLMCKHIATLDEQGEELTLWRKAIEGDELRYETESNPLNRTGQAQGTLIGGNLSVLYGLQGTPYAIDTHYDEPPILFIEDIAERHYHIDRMMNNLRLSGVLSRIGGLVVGQFSDCDMDPGMGESIYDTIRRATEEYHYPILFNFPAGHVTRNLPLRMGAKATLHVHDDGAWLTC